MGTQLNIYGKATTGNCVFCGINIAEVSTDKYLTRNHHRCAECHIEFWGDVFSLTEEQKENLRQKWIRKV